MVKIQNKNSGVVSMLTEAQFQDLKISAEFRNAFMVLSENKDEIFEELKQKAINKK